MCVSVFSGTTRKMERRKAMGKNVNEKICIIGGGPAGLAAAMYLEKKGYGNYTILEKSDHVGGKCNSPVYKGKRYEMGAIMGVPEYRTIGEIMEFCGVKPDGPMLDREFRRPNGKVYNPFGGIRLFKGVQVKSQVKRLGNLLETKYKGYDKNGHYEKVHPDMTLPFDDFVTMNKVPAVRDIWINPFTSFGYGFFDNVATAYVLKYLDMPTMISFIKKDLWTWANGTQYIWECLNEKLKNKAVLNADIKKVTRTGGKVQVTTQDGTEEYDKLIITAPLDGFIEYADADKDEKEYFSKITHNDYLVHACLVKNYPTISGYLPDNMTPRRLGHVMVYYHRWAGEPDQVITTYVLRNHPDLRTLSVEECRKMVLEDMKSYGFEVKEIINEKSWYYFPHVSAADYKAGWYDKVEGMQGRNNTYYAGEVMSFGDMDETAEYSKGIAERFF